jgi:hypothetical protein
MKSRGHPIVGAIAGFVFGISLDLLLLTSGVLPLGSIVLALLPPLMLLLGIAWGMFAPLGRSAPTAPVAASPVAASPDTLPE